MKSILPFIRLLSSNAKVKHFSTCRAISAVVSFRLARTNSCSSLNFSSVHTKPPNPSINLSTAQAMQSSISSNTLPNGAKYKPSFALFGSFSCKYLMGEGTFSNNKRRKPACIACVCSASVSNNFTPTAVCSSTIAGYAFTLKCCFFCS